MMNRHTRNLMLLAVISGILLLVGCATTQGNIKDNLYSSPMDNFSCKIPNYPGLRIRDDYNQGGGNVSFYGEEGNLNSIVYWHLKPRSIALVKDPDMRRSFYTGFFKDYVMPKMFLSLSPQIRVLYKDFISYGEGEFLFAVLEMAEAETFLEQSFYARNYVVRGIFIFSQGEYIYLLSDQYALPSEMSREWDPPSPQQVKSRVDALTSFYNSIYFD